MAIKVFNLAQMISTSGPNLTCAYRLAVTVPNTSDSTYRYNNNDTCTADNFRSSHAMEYLPHHHI